MVVSSEKEAEYLRRKAGKQPELIKWPWKVKRLYYPRETATIWLDRYLPAKIKGRLRSAGSLLAGIEGALFRKVLTL